MKTVCITETDNAFVRSFSSFLVQLGARPLPSDPRAFEVDDTFDTSSYHGLTEKTARSPVSPVKPLAPRTPGISPVKPLVPGQPKPERTYSIKPGQILIVKKWFARKLAQQAGCAHPHFAFEILKVEGETEKAYRVTLKMSARRTSYCSVCGITLTNAASIAAGIGPICAENWGIDMGASSLADLEAKLAVTQEVLLWMPKSVIKEVV